MNLNIDDEWNNFISKKYDNESSDEENNTLVSEDNENENENENSIKNVFNVVPTPTPIYISTKSKIAYLTQPVDLRIFWDIPVISYATPKDGVIKKQIKINCKTPDELTLIQNRLQNELYYDEHIINHIDNPTGRIVFKDIRKITIGISKKDIMSYRSKKKQAFYNCFVMILRIKIDDLFREFHIKVFNTGKLEIPGVQTEYMFETVLKYIVNILQPFYPTKLTYFEKSDTVLINSNFNCGFYINREILYDILRAKYNIQAIYDPCSYPGIQCKFYYNNDIGVQNGKQITTENKDKYKNIVEVSFMIFRTGSVLIVGMCDEYVLEDIYVFLKALLKEEFKLICQKIISPEEFALKDKKKKSRRKIININIVETNNDLLIETNNVELKEVLNNTETETNIETSINIIVTAAKKTRKPRKLKVKN